MSAICELAVGAMDNGLLAQELAAGIQRVKSVKSIGVRLGNWLSQKQAQALLNTPDVSTLKGLRDRAIIAVLLDGRRLRKGPGEAHHCATITLWEDRFIAGQPLNTEHPVGTGVAVYGTEQRAITPDMIGSRLTPWWLLNEYASHAGNRVS